VKIFLKVSQSEHIHKILLKEASNTNQSNHVNNYEEFNIQFQQIDYFCIQVSHEDHLFLLICMTY